MPNFIHETPLRDLIDLISTATDYIDPAKRDKKFINKKNNKSAERFDSLTRATNKLILVFPVLCTKGISIETASMMSKAIERRCVNLLQMLLASVQLTDTTSLTDFISRYHSNISIGDKITVDDYIDFDNTFSDFVKTIHNSVEIGELKVTDKVVYEQFKEGMNEFNDFIKTTLNENSLSNYACHKTYNGYETVLEYIATSGPDTPNSFTMYEDDYDTAKDHKRFSKNKNAEYKRQFKNRMNKDEYDRTKGIDRTEFINKLSENDIKKANELMPTKVIVDFYSTTAGTKLERGIIGVKCKLYPVDSLEIVERISSKYIDTNWVRGLVRASTGEISFWRDFVFALDRAKIDAINANKQNSSSKMWKVLERRATKNKLNKWKMNKADASPITTLIVSQDEVEYLKKDYNINLENRNIANKLMAEYNFMGLSIVDEPAESASFIWDEGNDANYETLSFRNLERESDDRNYRKVINLMTKISR